MMLVGLVALAKLVKCEDIRAKNIHPTYSIPLDLQYVI